MTRTAYRSQAGSPCCRTSCAVAARGCLALGMIAIFSGSLAQAQAASTSCRASAARISGPPGLTPEPVVANPSATPCTTQSQRLAGDQSVGAITVTDPEASTENSAGRLSGSASVDAAQGSGVIPIGIGHVNVTQVLSCTNGTSAASGSSSVDGLTIAGIAVSIVGGQALDETIAGVRIRTNQLRGNTRQALVLDVSGSEYVLGEASAAGNACATLPTGGGEGGTGVTGAGSGPGANRTSGGLAVRRAASQLALQCGARRLILIDVLTRGDHVALLGAADKSLVGRLVSITFLADHKRVAGAVVGIDGFFATTAPLPTRRLRSTNKARYQASIGAERSASLKLTRRMTIESISSRAGKVIIHGRVIRPLAVPIAPILIERRVSCSSTVTVKAIEPGRSGIFTATLLAPPHSQAAVYRASTRVRGSVRGRGSYPTFTLPRVVVIR